MAKNLNLEMVLSAKERITGPLKKVQASSSGVAKALRETKQRSKELERQQSDVEGYQKAQKELESTHSALKQARESQKGYQKALEDQRLAHETTTRQTKDARNEYRRLSRQMEKAQNPSAELTQEYQKAANRLAELERQQDESSAAIKGYKRQVKSADQEVERLNSETEKHSRNVYTAKKRLDEAGISTKNLGQTQQDMARKMERTNERIQRQKQFLSQINKADVGGRFNKMTGEVSRFGRRGVMALTGVSASIFGVANSTANLGDQVGKAAARIGIGREELQELQYAAERNGVSNLDGNLEKFQKRVGQAARGTGQARRALDDLGLSAERLTEMSPDAALEVVADRMAQVDNQSRKVSLAADLFSNQGIDMVNMLESGSEGLEKLRKESRRTGYVLSEQATKDAERFKDEMLDAGLSMKGLKNIIGAELMPVVADTMEKFSGWMADNRSQVSEFAATFAKRLRGALPAILQTAKGIGSMASSAAIMTGHIADLVGGFDNLGMILAALFALKPVMAIAGMAKGLLMAGNAVVTLMGGWSALGAAIRTVVTFIGGKGLAALKLLGQGIAVVAGAIKTLTVTLMTSPVFWAIGLLATAAYLIYKNWEPISRFFSNLWDGVTETFLAAWQHITKAFKGGIGEVAKLLLNWSPLGLLWKAITSALESLGVEIPDKFKSFGGAMIDGLLGGIKAKLGDIKDGIKNAASAAAGWFKDTLGISSPSKVFARFGDDTMAGYQRGLAKGEGRPLGQITQFSRRLKRTGTGLAMGAAALPAVAGMSFDDRAPVTASPAAGAQGGDEYHFHIQSSPGQDEHEIARQVQRILEQRDREKAARRRSALHDTE